MSLIQRMTALNARLTQIPIRLGVPQYRDLLIRHVSLDDDLLETSHTDTLLQPKPLIRNAGSDVVGLDVGRGILVEQRDFQVLGIPRSYGLEFLQNDVGCYVIDPVRDANGAIALDSRGNPQGIFCKLLTVRDKQLLTWEIILRQFNDHYDVSQTVVDY